MAAYKPRKFPAVVGVFQTKPKKKRDNPEQRLQIACVRYLDIQYGKDRLFYFHTPNGGKRSKAEAGLFKSMGVRAGVPDLLFLDSAVDKLRGVTFKGLAVELKTEGNENGTTDSQDSALEQLEYIGFKTAVVSDLETFIGLVDFHYGHLKHKPKWQRGKQ